MLIGNKFTKDTETNSKFLWMREGKGGGGVEKQEETGRRKDRQTNRDEKIKRQADK